MVLKSGIEIIVGELNAKNTQSFAPDDLIFGTPTADGVEGATLRFAGAPGTTLNGKGVETIHYQRISLVDMFSDIDQVNIHGGSTIYRVLKQLSQATGILLSEKDVEDGDILYTDDSATLSLVAKPDSLMYHGSVEISVVVTPLNIDAAILLRRVTWDGVISNNEEFIREVSRVNGYWLDYRGVTFSEIEENPGEFNSRITLTGNPEFGYIGEVVILFKRREISTVVGEPGYASLTPYTGSLLDYVEQNTPEIFDRVPKEDWIDVNVVYDGTTLLNQTVAITNNSYNYRGTFSYEFFPGNQADFAKIRGTYMLTAYLPSSVAHIRGAYMLVAYRDNV